MTNAEQQMENYTQSSIPHIPEKDPGSLEKNHPTPVEHSSENDADLEAARKVEGAKPTIVGWNGPDDPENPRKSVFIHSHFYLRNIDSGNSWSMKEKWIITGIISAFTFLSPISSSMVAPAAETQIAVDFHLTNPTMVAITISVFVLGYGANQVFITHSRIS